MAKADVAAGRLLTDLGVNDRPVDPEAIAEKLGVLVVAQDLEQEVSGMLIRDGDARVIGVNRRHALNRRRFTIAHELGHLQLHKGRSLILDTAIRLDLRDPRSSLATDREEIEANRFAAALLMPLRLVVEESARGTQLEPDELVTKLARIFKVSEAAMGFRLINLGLIS